MDGWAAAVEGRIGKGMLGQVCTNYANCGRVAKYQVARSKYFEECNCSRVSKAGWIKLRQVLRLQWRGGPAANSHSSTSASKVILALLVQFFVVWFGVFFLFRS